jgi:hypothetical protein
MGSFLPERKLALSLVCVRRSFGAADTKPHTHIGHDDGRPGELPCCLQPLAGRVSSRRPLCTLHVISMGTHLLALACKLAEIHRDDSLNPTRAGPDPTERASHRRAPARPTPATHIVRQLEGLVRRPARLRASIEHACNTYS